MIIVNICLILFIIVLLYKGTNNKIQKKDDDYFLDDTPVYVKLSNNYETCENNRRYLKCNLLYKNRLLASDKWHNTVNGISKYFLIDDSNFIVNKQYINTYKTKAQLEKELQQEIKTFKQLKEIY